MNFYSKNDVDRLLNGRIPLEDKFLKSIKLKFKI